MTTIMTNPNRLEQAVAFAREAGEFTVRLFYDPALAVERKGDQSPVTEADRGAELLLRERIGAAFPDDGILGEEFPEKPGTSGYRWLLDPIDGTKSFIHGVPIYSTLIGIEHEGRPVGGVIALPALGECLWAGLGQGAWHTSPRFSVPKQARVSNCANLSEALFLTSEKLTFDQTNREEAYREFENQARLTRTWGDAYGYFMVATGRADLMVDAEMSPWDAAPLLVIMQEAGGRFTDWQGNATIHGGEGVGSNGHLHDAAMAITRKF